MEHKGNEESENVNIKSEKTTQELIDLSQMRIKVVINEFLLFCMFDPFHHFSSSSSSCFFKAILVFYIKVIIMRHFLL